jgi:subtilisin family serine protease
MARRSRRALSARTFVCEALEARSLLAFVGPLPNPDANVLSTLLVGFAAGATPAVIRAELAPLDAVVTHSFPDGPNIVALGPGVSPQTAAAQLAHEPFVRYAEPDSIIHVDSVIPTDPLFPVQWGLSNQSGIDVDATDAWSVTHGSPNIVVAVVDSGLATNDPDFFGQLWTDPVTGIHGWNFINNNANLSDQDGHGTHVAGIIAAAGDNGYGGLGVAWGVKLMPLKFIKFNGNGDTAEAVQAIYFAVQHGARVINASWGGPQYDQGLHDAIAYAAANNVVFVTAAGNESADNDMTPSYPALFRFPNTLSVAAIDQDGNLATFSNYGPRTVDLAAPGVNIESTIPTGFASYSGTSMAAPFVSGTAALVLSVHPNWSAAQVVQQIMGTVRPLPSLVGRVISGGMVDAAAAVGATPVPVQTFGQPPAISDDLARAEILSSDNYFAIHGGTNATYLQALYHTLLGRDIDAASLVSWENMLNSGGPRINVVMGILNSSEAMATKISEWVIQDFNLPTSSLASLKLLGPVADWVAQLVAGTITDAQIQAELLGSDSLFATQGNNLVNYVNAVYEIVLGRPVDSGGAFTWVSQLLAGTPRTNVAASILASPEAKLTEAARWFDTDFKLNTSVATLKSNSAIITWSQQIGG